MPVIPSQFLKDADGTPPLPSLEELWVALTRPADATVAARSYVRSHPRLAEELRELGLADRPAPDASE